LCSGRLKEYKYTLYGLSHVFFGNGQESGSGFQHNITPFGVSGSQFTMAATNIMACGLTRQCDLCLWTTHSAAFPVKPAW